MFSRCVMRCTPCKVGTVRACLSTSPSEQDQVNKKYEQSVYESESGASILSSFKSSNNSFLEFHKFNLFDPKLKERYRRWKKINNINYLIEDQKFIEERHSVLGNDLATAHFIVFRGGRVKNHSSPLWITKPEADKVSEDLPNKFVRGWYLKEIDCSGLPLRYEGLVNFRSLKLVETIIFRGCPYVDEWFIDRISHMFSHSLKHLDLSDCPLITERALACIYRFHQLETLKLYNIVNSVPFKLSCILLEDAIPNLKIEGVQYNN